MSDELRIRHVRLCECGLPADHISVCQPSRLAAAQRVDEAWATEQAERRELRHAKRQPGFRSERHSARARLSNAELHALAGVRAAKLSPIGAGNIAPSHGAAGHPSVNLALKAGSVELGQDPRWSGAHASERRALMRKHELLDEYEGLGPASSERELSPEEKDAAIVSPEHEHLSAAEFARQFPGYGSPSTVGKKRRWFRAGFCTMSGLPPPRPGCHCPTCRHAVERDS